MAEEILSCSPCLLEDSYKLWVTHLYPGHAGAGVATMSKEVTRMETLVPSDLALDFLETQAKQVREYKDDLVVALQSSIRFWLKNLRIIQ